MLSFPKETIVKDLEKFAVSIKSSYELTDIKILFKEENEIAKIGYIFSREGKEYKAYIPRVVLDNGEYEVKDKESWILETPNKKIDKNLLTIGHIMTIVMNN